MEVLVDGGTVVLYSILDFGVKGSFYFLKVLYNGYLKRIVSNVNKLDMLNLFIQKNIRKKMKGGSENADTI